MFDEIAHHRDGAMAGQFNIVRGAAVGIGVPLDGQGEVWLRFHQLDDPIKMRPVSRWAARRSQMRN